MSYSVRYRASALKRLEGLDGAIRERLARRIAEIAEQPRGPSCIALQGRAGYRVRVGDYRIVYTVDDSTRAVTIEVVDHRRDVYRR